MMPDQLFPFLILAFVFIVIPGPNILIIVSTSLSSGRVRGLQTVAGTASAMAIQLVVAALATSSIMLLLSRGLIWLKWIGAAYLLYLGVRSLWRFWQRAPTEKVSATGSFQRGFWVSITNPKTIFFFSAFLPQFVSNGDFYLQQITILSASFWMLALVCDTAYSLLAARFTRLTTNAVQTARIQNGLSGTLYLAASAALANSHRV